MVIKNGVIEVLWSKPRSKFGKWIDKLGVNQIEIEQFSDLSRGTVSKLCNDKNYKPKYSTFMQLNRGLKKSRGIEVNYEDFWG